MTVAYLGTAFRGFADQPGQRTVAGCLAAAIERRLRERVELTCAGRTDSGVHATGQVVSFDVADGTDLEALCRSLNRSLGPEIVVREARSAPGFDARWSASSRSYRYTVLNTETADPLTAATSWHVPVRLDVRSMQIACDPLIGEHDFSTFCRRPPAGSLIRRVKVARWSGDPGGVLTFEVEASSFCHQMVRSMVGTMIEMGRGRRRAGEMAAILRARDRALAGQPAPPQGLCLWRVTYGDGGA